MTILGLDAKLASDYILQYFTKQMSQPYLRALAVSSSHDVSGVINDLGGGSNDPFVHGLLIWVNFRFELGNKWLKKKEKRRKKLIIMRQEW